MIKIKIIALLLILAAVLAFIVFRPSNNDGQIIDKAIKAKNANLCEKIKETTRPGPADAPEKIFGTEAVDWCKYQVEQDQRIFGG